MQGEVISSDTPLAGDQTALSSSVVGTTLKLVAPKGAYDGVGSKVVITDANFADVNIKGGVSIFGKMGTLNDGTGMKKYAEGIVTVDGTGVLTVSGLSFRPSIVVTVRDMDWSTGKCVYHTQWSSSVSYALQSAVTYTGNSTSSGGFTIKQGVLNDYIFWKAWQ